MNTATRQGLWFVGLLFAVLNVSCGNLTARLTLPAIPSPQTAATPTPTPPPAMPVSGSFCTAVSQFDFEPSTLQLKCVQDNGEWQVTGGVIDGTTACANRASPVFMWPHLERMANGDLLIGYNYCNGGAGGGHVMKRYNAATGWRPVATVPANTDSSGNTLGSYSQFGPGFTELNGRPLVFWTSGLDAYVSTVNNAGTWDRQRLPGAPKLYRHPEILRTSTKLYVYFGQPAPTVFEMTGGTPVSLGSVPVAADEYTLYTSLAEWNGGLVLAYSSFAGPALQSWYDTTDRIKVAFRSGAGSWQVSTAPVQDTPGHDGLRPFLFVVSGELHIMFHDYTTEGVPGDAGYRYYKGRFRVKKWNAATLTWQTVGWESDQFYFSQRLEYLLDGNVVLFSALKYDSTSERMDQVVVTWQDGVFGQLGGVVRSSSRRERSWSTRPGSVVRVQ